MTPPRVGGDTVEVSPDKRRDHGGLVKGKIFGVCGITVSDFGDLTVPDQGWNSRMCPQRTLRLRPWRPDRQARKETGCIRSLYA